MMMRPSYIVCSILPAAALLCNTHTCQSADSAALSAVFSDPVQMEIMGGNHVKKSLKKGAEVTLPTDYPVWIEAPGKIPLLIFPSDSRKATRVQIHLRSVEDWPSLRTQRLLDKGLSELAESVFQIQGELRKRNVDQALTMANQLQSKYPEVAYLNFILASIEVMKGDREAALRSVRKGLELHPDNVEGQSLLKTLEGGNR